VIYGLLSLVGAGVRRPAVPSLSVRGFTKSGRGERCEPLIFNLPLDCADVRALCRRRRVAVIPVSCKGARPSSVALSGVPPDSPSPCGIAGDTGPRDSVLECGTAVPPFRPCRVKAASRRTTLRPCSAIALLRVATLNRYTPPSGDTAMGFRPCGEIFAD
jgi:hypothetical protein